MRKAPASGAAQRHTAAAALAAADAAAELQEARQTVQAAAGQGADQPQPAAGQGAAAAVAPADPVVENALAGQAAAQAQLAALQQMVQQQQQLLQQVISAQQSPAASPQHSPQPSPRRVTDGAHGGAVAAAVGVPAGAEAQPQQQSRFARKEPRAQDLREYDGASGTKLDEWLQELTRATRLFQLNDREAVDFGTSRLTGAALQWSLTLTAQQQAVLVDAGALGAALRARFQPVTAARVAREQLRTLRQGNRSINDYIADFQRLRAQLPDMAEADALFAFEAGASRDIAVELRKQRVTTAADAIALAAHIGSVADSAQHSRAAAAANQMEDDSSVSLDERILRAVLNAMQHSQQGSSDSQGLGAKLQTQRGYKTGARRPRRQSRWSWWARWRTAPRRAHPPPGVPDEVIEQRREAGRCFRCGEKKMALL